MQISIVIPTLNEADRLSKTLGLLKAQDPPIDLWVVDGGSQDQTCQIAAEWGVQILHSDRGRADQLNQGAHHATGDILLFLHADTQLPQHFQSEIQAVLAQEGVVAGAFPLAIENAGWGLQWVAWWTNQRSRWLQLPYGDQALFLKRSQFQAIGNFPLLPIMEDFELVRRLRKQGKIGLAQSPVLTSDRRWRKLGLVRTTLINQLMILGYFAGISPQILATWYRSHRGKN
jgi:rSAM/selenodomain-associated transferase 2